MSSNINNTTISIMFEEIKQAVKQLENKLSQREQSKDDSLSLPDIESILSQSNEQVLSRLEDIFEYNRNSQITLLSKNINFAKMFYEKLSSFCLLISTFLLMI